MTTAIYPGSFNPWHEGHTDILVKARKVFHRVIVAVGINPDKPNQHDLAKFHERFDHSSDVEIMEFSGLLVDFAHKVGAGAIIRGLRNGSDLQYEQNQQYWNEDLGLNIPTVYFICDRKLSHISSSAIRAIGKIKGSK